MSFARFTPSEDRGLKQYFKKEFSDWLFGYCHENFISIPFSSFFLSQNYFQYLGWGTKSPNPMVVNVTKEK